MNSLMFLLGVIVIIALLCVYWLLLKALDLILYFLNILIEKSSVNEETKNNVLSVLYFFKDMGPNVSSFAIIAMVVTSHETVFQLTIIFILGIILKEMSRKLTKRFMNLVVSRKGS